MRNIDLDSKIYYTTKEKFIRDFISEKEIYIFISAYIFIFFNIAAFILFKSNLINIDVNEIISDSGVSNLKDASLYLFSAQATLIGLIFPIVISYISLVNVGRASSDNLMKIYKNHSGFSIVATSSFLLLFFYGLLFVTHSFLNSILFITCQVYFLFWFIFNLFLILNFLSKTIDFIDGNRKIQEIIKYSYHNKENVFEGFMIILDEVNYHIENKHITRAEELILKAVDYIEISVKKHDLDEKIGFFGESYFEQFLNEIRRQIDTALDYNDIKYVRRLLYIYYYIGRRLHPIDNLKYTKTLLEMHYIISIDINKKINMNDNVKKILLSKLLDSWTSWEYIIKDKENLIHYSYYTIQLISDNLEINKNLDRLFDTFLKIPSDIGYSWLNLKGDFVKTIADEYSESSIINFCIDTKFCLVKIILDSDLNIQYIQFCIEKILNNGIFLKGTTQIHTQTEVATLDDLIFSLLRIIGDSPYSDYLNNFFSDKSDRVANRIYWGDTSNYFSKVFDAYAIIYNSLFSKKSWSNFKFNAFLKNTDQSKILEILDSLNSCIDILNHSNLKNNFFDSKKNELIKKRFLILIIQIKNEIDDYLIKLNQECNQ